MFDFLKYIKSNWYFLKKPKLAIPYWVDIDLIDTNLLEKIDFFENYQDHKSKKIDAAYQLWLKGYISNNSNQVLNEQEYLMSRKDIYIFIRRFYHWRWLIFTLFFRVCEGKNLFLEIYYFSKGLKSKKIDVYKHVFSVDEYETFDSSLIKSNPKITVVIPTLNRYKYLEDVIKDLEKQSYTNFEVIIVDQSDNFRSEFYENRKLDLTVINQKEKALWTARNTAVFKGKGEFFLLYDDDSLINDDWIFQHLKTLDYFKADISSGVSLSVIGGTIPKHYSYFRWSDQIDTGNVLIHRDVFKKTGMFDLQFEKQRMGDGEFGMRCYLEGFKNISNPFASRVHLKVSEGGLRQMGLWDAWSPKSIFSPRPIPSVLYFIRKYWGNNAALREIVISVLPSIVPYKYKSNKVMLIIGSIIGLFSLPIIFVAIIRSWKIASQRLKQGAIIHSLNG
jgi:glycosyltransferase involved in cell wall biosynthesis